MNQSFQAEIDKNVTLLRQEILRVSALNSQRNSLSPISKLPRETLILIFNEILDSSSKPTSADMLPIGQVCRLWRDLVMNCTELWLYLVLEGGSAIHPDILLRSEDYEISLRIHHEGEECYKGETFAKEFVPKNLYRITDLDIHLLCTNDSDLGLFVETSIDFNRVLSTPAPVLHTLHIESDQAPSIQPLFAGDAPMLRELSLSRLGVDWGWAIFPQLTHLTLTSTETRLQMRVLGSMIALEYLHLDNSLPYLPPTYIGVVPTAEIIELSYLHVLTVIQRTQSRGDRHSGLSCCAHFLSHI